MRILIFAFLFIGTNWVFSQPFSETYHAVDTLKISGYLVGISSHPKINIDDISDFIFISKHQEFKLNKKYLKLVYQYQNDFDTLVFFRLGTDFSEVNTLFLNDVWEYASAASLPRPSKSEYTFRTKSSLSLIWDVDLIGSLYLIERKHIGFVVDLRMFNNTADPYPVFIVDSIIVKHKFD